MNVDVAILGGGPTGLSAALTLGRALKRVAVFDAGPRRNARAHAVNTFLTRDGVRPQQLRDLAWEQMRKYDTVIHVDERVEALDGSLAEGFRVNGVHARRVLLATGMLDELPAIDGLARLWGQTVFTCPFCHGFELARRRWAVLAETEPVLLRVPMLRGWTDRLVVLGNGALQAQGVDGRRIARLEGEARLERVVFTEGPPLELDALVVHPHQRQVPVVERLGLALDDLGYVKVDRLLFETSRPGVHAAGDCTTMRQGAMAGAGEGMLAAAGLVHALTQHALT